MKKTITTITLAFVITLGATSTFAFDGILVADRSTPSCSSQTTDKDGIIVFGRDGIIVFGRSIITSIVNAVSDAISSDASQPCTSETEGIIVFG